jgi:hypothetical protein
MERTEAERELVSRTERAFGKHLTTFMLGRRDGQVPSPSLSYVAAFSEGGEEKTNHLRVVAEDASGLPEYKQSLVLIALLLLLLEGGEDTSYNVSYTYDAMAARLGLENTEKTRAEIELAVVTYFNLSYERDITFGTEGREQATGSKLKERLVIGYEFVEEVVGEDRPPERAGNVVSFNPCFVEGLKTKSLLGVNWEGVRSLRVVE